MYSSISIRLSFTLNLSVKCPLSVYRVGVISGLFTFNLSFTLWTCVECLTYFELSDCLVWLCFDQTYTSFLLRA